VRLPCRRRWRGRCASGRGPSGQGRSREPTSEGRDTPPGELRSPASGRRGRDVALSHQRRHGDPSRDLDQRRALLCRPRLHEAGRSASRHGRCVAFDRGTGGRIATAEWASRTIEPAPQKIAEQPQRLTGQARRARKAKTPRKGSRQANARIGSGALVATAANAGGGRALSASRPRRAEEASNVPSAKAAGSAGCVPSGKTPLLGSRLRPGLQQEVRLLRDGPAPTSASTAKSAGSARGPCYAKHSTGSTALGEQVSAAVIGGTPGRSRGGQPPGRREQASTDGSPREGVPDGRKLRVLGSPRRGRAKICAEAR